VHKVTLANGVEFMRSEIQTVLDAAKASNVLVQHSCRSGCCGGCSAPILQGETKVVVVEESLSDSDVVSGKVLTCCRSPLADICPDIDNLSEIGSLKTLTLPCRIGYIELFNNDVLGVVLRLPPNSDFMFLYGQYLYLIKGDVRRSYCIANALRVDGKIELQVKQVEQGLMSTTLFAQTRENDPFRVGGFLGTFSYRDDGEENITLIATGTGISPFKGLLESYLRDESKKNIFVDWSARF
jgi:CDP-4-dehydro-6-deoxyglucose reductase, E3